ncbi:odorant receptor 13a-like isoform X1 [Macrosteles quadrilineatus]|nr:odorant receptor 13a-like isoform X1 [Macrosteles quadrilineatus]
MILSDIFTVANLVTIGVNLLAPNVSITKRCYSGFTALATAQSVIKLVACYISRNKFAHYFKLWDNLVEKSADRELQKSLTENSKWIKRLSTFMFLFMVGPMIPWGSLPLFIKVLSYIIPALEDGYHFIAVPAQFPFDPLVSPAYEFVTVFQGVAAAAVNSKLIAYDCMIYGLISCLVVKLKFLKTSFKSIVDPYQGRSKSVLLKKGVRNHQKHQLSRWVQEHCDLMDLCRYLNRLYSPVLLLQLFLDVLILCSNAFVVASATVTKMEIMFSFGYVLGTVIQLYTLCWLGEEITNQSLTLTDEGFWQEWYSNPRYITSSLKIIFEKAKVPLKISAFGTFNLSIETFKSIVGTAYSYFMVLNQIKKKSLE